MRILLTVLALLAGSGLSAQTTDEELAALRKHLKVSAATTLGPATSLSLPPADPLKVYVATGLDLTVRANLERWIAEWNRKEAKRRRRIEVVAEPGQADVILARYLVREKVRSRSVAAPDLFPSTPGTRRGSRTRFTFDLVPVYAYVIDSREPGAWRIIWRHNGFVPLEETKGSGREAWDGLRGLLKSAPSR